MQGKLQQAGENNDDEGNISIDDSIAITNQQEIGNRYINRE